MTRGYWIVVHLLTSPAEKHSKLCSQHGIAPTYLQNQQPPEYDNIANLSYGLQCVKWHSGILEASSCFLYVRLEWRGERYRPNNRAFRKHSLCHPANNLALVSWLENQQQLTFRWLLKLPGICICAAIFLFFEKAAVEIPQIHTDRVWFGGLL